MHMKELLQARAQASNRREYGVDYESIRWITQDEALQAGAVRRELLQHLSVCARLGYNDTKIDCTNLSPGCVLCAEGAWSCLFINGKCNCRCFYCPTPQDEIGVPMTNTLAFPRVDDYTAYLERFGFTGVSISGGEPLLTLQTTMEYVTALKKRFGEKIYLWLYTNGTLAGDDTLRRLRDLGLDEIRFDIGATRYDLEHARRAVGLIPRVTVEIPVVPEDAALLEQRLHAMQDLGIDHLNLHQLRLTPHNRHALVRRGYTFLHGEKVTVLESELAALRLIAYAHDNGVGLGVNYCSFVYKNRFQKAAARRRSAACIARPWEDITPSGYIRQLCLAGESPRVLSQVERFEQSGVDPQTWSLDGPAPRLTFKAPLWPLVDFTRLKLSVAYDETMILPRLTYRNLFIEIELNKARRIAVERVRALAPLEIDGEDVTLMRGLVCGDSVEPALGLVGGRLDGIRDFERIPTGLQCYF